MKSLWTWLIIVAVVAAAAGGGYWLGRRAAAKPEEADPSDSKKEEDKPVPTVSVVPLRRGTMVDQVRAYGSVVAPASEVRVVSVPFESRVTKLSVTPGEPVTEGQPLVQVEASAATQLAVEEARNAEAAAQRDLDLVKQRFDQKLATNADLAAAENALRIAQGRLKSLQQAGAGGPRELKAEAAGIVSKVDVQIGQVVPIGSPLVDVAGRNQIEVKLGIEPRDAPFLKPGQAVQLQPIDRTGGKAIEGKIKMIGQDVDPASRLVDARVSLPEDAGLLLDSYVLGMVDRASDDALIVPRDSVLPDESGFTLFTVKDGHAVKHTVKVGIENDNEAQVIADDLKAGDAVVTVGNLELEDGMAVDAQPATQPSGTQPSASRSAPHVRFGRLVPSPGTPGEGRGEGVFFASVARDPHPNPLPEHREREQDGRPRDLWVPTLTPEARL